MSRQTDAIVSALAMLSLAFVAASFASAVLGAGGEVHLALCGCWAALMAQFVMDYTRWRG